MLREAAEKVVVTVIFGVIVLVRVPDKTDRVTFGKAFPLLSKLRIMAWAHRGPRGQVSVEEMR